jgi:hypothetical protein
MFVPFHIARWLRGATQVGLSDAIPDDAMRRGNNVRVDRTLGAVEVRPGWTLASTTALAATVVWLSKLVVSAATTVCYRQSNGNLSRETSAFAVTNAAIAVPGNQVISDVNSPDGNGHFLKYFVNQTIAVKDNGTTATGMGIAPPTAAPTTAALATDLFTQIDTFEAGGAATWTGSALSAGPADDPAIFQQGTGSMSFSIAASTFGSVAKDEGAINLDTLTGGDDLVKNDDYIFLWVRCTSPQNLTYIQIDIDIDSATTGVADAFRRNYYSFRGSALTRLAAGTNEWTKLQVRKSEFTRYGTDTARSWANSRVFRIGFLTNNSGGVSINIDDFKLRGGVGIEGTITYTVCYRNSTTMGRGNPPKDSSGVVLYTSPLVVDRQRVNLTTTNVRSGGANNPGDAQVDKLMIFRKGGIFTTSVLVDTIAIAALSPYLDHTSDATLVLTNIALETDNDVPPTAAATRFIFGPDGSGHYFMVVDGYRLYICKPYETLENRVENWPALGFALIGDGSTQAVAGLATTTQIRLWSTAISYNVVGVGQDTFLPVALDGTRGAVGQNAVTSGDGVIFFVSQDGIYEDSNGQQRKLTGSIDKFFQGIAVDGQLGWSTAVTDMADVRLAFLHEPTGSVLVMTYVDSSGAQNHLTLKPNAQTGQLTEIFFDVPTDTLQLHSFFLDAPNRQLLAGAANGQVYHIEDSTKYSDDSNGIAFTFREKSYDIGQPQHGKYVSHFEIEGNTSGQNVTVTAYYDRGAVTEVLGTLNTNSDTAVQQFPAASSTTARRDIAVQLDGTATQRVMISRIGRYCEPQPEALTFWDSGNTSFDFIQQFKRMQLDLNASAVCTIKVYIDGGAVAAFTGTVPILTGRQSRSFPLSAGLQGRTFRVTISSSVAFIPYHFTGFFKQLGIDQDYVQRPLVQGV